MFPDFVNPVNTEVRLHDMGHKIEVLRYARGRVRLCDPAQNPVFEHPPLPHGMCVTDLVTMIDDIAPAVKADERLQQRRLRPYSRIEKVHLGRHPSELAYVVRHDLSPMRLVLVDWYILMGREGRSTPRLGLILDMWENDLTGLVEKYTRAARAGQMDSVMERQPRPPRVSEFLDTGQMQVLRALVAARVNLQLAPTIPEALPSIRDKRVLKMAEDYVKNQTRLARERGKKNRPVPHELREDIK